ncbi:MAG: hypothetical protein B6D39_02815 [Anaerolineae bacterium UTCFX2]|jgi:hypothetical protein|nr:DNA alkylation repair protein [Anaerolineales bacterium]OQY93493.1 MAG: hypothetical protein B6D39_02815 [Anaerolineae bacterium UTCFX2]
MPAIQPALLRQQAAELAEHFADPPVFIRSLHHLLGFYADRARHPGQSGAPPPIITAYKVRPPVLRMILQQLIPLAIEEPRAGLALCDSLWAEPYLEPRLLAAMLLGQIPAEPPAQILERILAWLAPNLEFFLIDAVMKNSFVRLQKEQPRSIVRLIQDWLALKDPFYKQLGLRALLPLIENPEFQNMPVFFRLIQPLTSQTPSVLRPDLLDVLVALARRSPQETGFFLQQTLNMPDSEDTAWLIRQSLDEFPPELQQTLRAAERQSVENR